MAVCGLCNKWMTECEQDNFCARTIINKKKSIIIENEFGEKITYFSFANATEAMQEYGNGILLKTNTYDKQILTEKTNNHENESN